MKTEPHLVDLRKNFQEFGGWPLIGPIGGTDWDSSRFDLPSFLSQISRVGGVQTFLDINTEPDTAADTQLKIHVSGGNLGMAPKEFEDPRKLQIYSDFLSDLVMTVAEDAKSARSSADINTDLQAVIAFEKSLAAILYRNRYASFEDVDMANVKVPSLSIFAKKFLFFLQTFFFQEPFANLIRSVDQDPTFRPFLAANPVLRVANQNTLSKMKTLIDATDSKILTNYIILHYLVELAPYLDRRYVDFINVRLNLKLLIRFSNSKTASSDVELNSCGKNTASSKRRTCSRI